MVWLLVALVVVVGLFAAAWWIDRKRKGAPLSSDRHARYPGEAGDIGTGAGGMH